VIETAETVALPAPNVVPDGPNKVMDAADTTVGPRRKARRRKSSQRHRPNDCESVSLVAARAYYDLNTTVFTMSKSGPVSKGANIVIAPTTADTVVNERPSSSIFAV
jgi:hypothetical protein